MSRPRTVLASAAYAALALADSAAAGRDGSTARRLRRLLKPALMPVLAAAFLDATHGGGGRPGALRVGTAAAEAFSWVGDVALLGTSRRSFLAGVGAFCGAHVSYIVAFASVRGEREDHDTAGLKATAGLWLTATPVMSLAAGQKDVGLRVPVAAYATILSAMFATSRTLDPRLPRAARRTLQAGTALFLISDTVLAVQKFVLPRPRPVLESVVMATYTAGQGLIAAGVARATLS